jgi:hypothetical protein
MSKLSDYKSWGNPTWVFLHTMVSKINHQSFHKHKDEIINYIFKICSNLPCPECSTHAIDFLKTVRFNNVSKKEDLIEIMYVFHNQVNKNINKKEFPIESLSIYTETDGIQNALLKFIPAYTKGVSPLLMAQTHARKMIISSLKTYIYNNLNIYS